MFWPTLAYIEIDEIVESSLKSLNSVLSLACGLLRLGIRQAHELKHSINRNETGSPDWLRRKRHSCCTAAAAECLSVRSLWRKNIVDCEARLAELIAVEARSSREERRREVQLPAFENEDETIVPDHDVKVP